MLYDEPFVAVFPSLVREMGGDVTAAAVLQHLYFRAASREQYEDADGVIWWPATLDEIADEIGISHKQAKRVVQKLRDTGHLQVEQLGGTDRRNFYSITGPSMGPNGLMEDTQMGPSKEPKRADVLPIRNLEEERQERSVMRKPVDDHDEMFAAFWSAYPRKVSKGSARRAWSKAILAADPSVIIAGAVRYANDPNREEQFTAHASTWLNGERWLDEPLPNRDSRADRKMTEVEEMIRRAAERDATREIEA